MKLKHEGECEACNNVGPLFQMVGSSMKLCETHYNAELKVKEEKEESTPKFRSHGHTVDTIFPPEVIRAIQIDEREEIASLSIEQLSNRISEYQQTSRELYLRMMESSTELHKRLSSKDSDELEGLVERVPSAETHLTNRRVGQIKKRETFADTVQKNARKAIKDNPIMAEFLESLKAK